MIVNFRVRKISRVTRKLNRISTLIKKKVTKLSYDAKLSLPLSRLQW